MKKKPKKYRENKKAFDDTMALYRNAFSAIIGASQIKDSSRAKYKTGIRPSTVEFRADVAKVVKVIVKEKDDLQWFWAAYMWDSPSDIECEVFVQRMLGNRRHSWEQRIGELLRRKGIYPSTDYFQKRTDDGHKND